MESMKMTASEKKESSPEVAMPKQDPYPYGLRLELNRETIKKLGIELPEVGEVLELRALAKVVSCHASQQEGGDEYASCSLQITDMEVKAETDVKAIASRLYKDDKGDA